MTGRRNVDRAAREFEYISDWCPTGKRSYPSKADAKRMLKQRPQVTGSSIYRCEQCEWFHTGHLPRSVKSGKYDRDSLR